MTAQILTRILPICFLLLLTTCVAAQPDEKNPGIKLFDNGDFAGAVEFLKKSDDFVDLNYLGYAYEKLGKEKEARNAFDRSFRIGYKEFEEDIIVRSSFEKDKLVPVDKLSDFVTKSSDKLLVVVLSARRTLELKGPSTDENDWLMKARMFSEIGRIITAGRMLYSARELDSPAKITKKSFPGYTNEASSNNVQGTVTLLVLFEIDGTVKAAIPVKSLSHGLTERAIIAASKIVFTPAERKNIPVATLQTLSYSFSIR